MVQNDSETPIFGIQGNDLTDQIERKGRNGIPQDAFCFSMETLGYRNGTLITMMKSGFWCSADTNKKKKKKKNRFT